MFLVFVHLAIYIPVFLLEIKDVCEIGELELSNDTDNKLIKNNNYVAKIDVLDSVTSIFAEISQAQEYQNLHCNCS